MAMDDPGPRGELTLRTVAMPADANPNGDIFGGWVLSQMDLAGGIAAGQRADGRVVTVAINAMTFIKPVNVGFGYSYALPIIVAGLIAQPGEILIVENPEAHLHPYAQSQITKFLVKVSANGVQVFIESHSDHVLNALRICVLDKMIATDELHVLYFGKGQPPEVTRIPVQDDGAIEVWPEGFFDQMDKDFSRLFGV